MSDYKEEIKKLTSQVVQDRISAARFLGSNNFREAIEPLKRRLRVERVMHVKRAIKIAINNLETAGIGEVLDKKEKYFFEEGESLQKYMKAKAIDQFSGVLLHELAPKLGLLKASAKSEINEYAGSQVEKQIDGIHRILEAIKNLRRSTAAPETTEMNLHEIILDVCTEEVSEGVSVNYVGDQPCIVRCDYSLLELALKNAIRNANEALLSVDDGKPKNLIVSWGVTDVECWISIIDDGPGFNGAVQDAYAFGATNKDGHTGFGLGIIMQSMESLDGVAELSSIKDSGARLVLRWGVVSE
ncbi:MAG: signal transduction histidine kinase [Oleispira sp.]